MTVGQADPDPGDSFTLSGTVAALKKLTPSLFVIGVATGAAFAIGAVIVDRLIDRR